MRSILHVWRRRAFVRGLIATLPARVTAEPASHVALLGGAALSWGGRHDG